MLLCSFKQPFSGNILTLSFRSHLDKFSLTSHCALNDFQRALWLGHVCLNTPMWRWVAPAPTSFCPQHTVQGAQRESLWHGDSPANDGWLPGHLGAGFCSPVAGPSNLPTHFVFPNTRVVFPIPCGMNHCATCPQGASFPETQPMVLPPRPAGHHSLPCALTMVYTPGVNNCRHLFTMHERVGIP